jgi:hypothetical protein
VTDRIASSGWTRSVFYKLSAFLSENLCNHNLLLWIYSCRYLTGTSKNWYFWQFLRCKCLIIRSRLRRNRYFSRFPYQISGNCVTPKIFSSCSHANAA